MSLVLEERLEGTGFRRLERWGVGQMRWPDRFVSFQGFDMVAFDHSEVMAWAVELYRRLKLIECLYDGKMEVESGGFRNFRIQIKQSTAL